MDCEDGWVCIDGLAIGSSDLLRSSSPRPAYVGIRLVNLLSIREGLHVFCSPISFYQVYDILSGRILHGRLGRWSPNWVTFGCCRQDGMKACIL